MPPQKKEQYKVETTNRVEKTLRAILIDSHRQLVMEVPVTGLKEIYAHLGCDLIDKGLEFETPWGIETLYIDDEGLLKDETEFFEVLGTGRGFAGSGLIVGTDEDGESTDCRLSVDSVADRILFLERDQAQARGIPVEPAMEFVAWEEA
jgi:hypothetical protein